MLGPIAFFHHASSPNENLLKEDASKASFQRLAELAEQKDIDLRFVLGKESFSNGVFNNYWKYLGGTYINIKESFTAEMIYPKSLTRIFDEAKRVNNFKLENIARDKMLTAQTFPRLVKKTLLIDSTDLSPLDQISTDLVVLKPRYGKTGIHVHVLPKTKITSQLLSNDTYIVQEFIDSSKGIPNLINQIHEMRIYIFNGNIQSAYLRLPAHGSYLANIAQGATVKLVDKSEIPQSFVAAALEVDKEFLDVIPRLYCIDMMNENDRPWVVELNFSPGLPDVVVQPLTDNYLNALLDLTVGQYP